MLTIWTLAMNASGAKIFNLPDGATPLCVTWDKGLDISFLVDTEKPTSDRHYLVLEEGEKFEPDGDLFFVGCVKDQSNAASHRNLFVFESLR